MAITRPKTGAAAWGSIVGLASGRGVPEIKVSLSLIGNCDTFKRRRSSFVMFDRTGSLSSNLESGTRSSFTSSTQGLSRHTARNEMIYIQTAEDMLNGGCQELSLITPACPPLFQTEDEQLGEENLTNKNAVQDKPGEQSASAFLPMDLGSKHLDGHCTEAAERASLSPADGKDWRLMPDVCSVLPLNSSGRWDPEFGLSSQKPETKKAMFSESQKEATSYSLSCLQSEPQVSVHYAEEKPFRSAHAMASGEQQVLLPGTLDISSSPAGGPLAQVPLPNSNTAQLSHATFPFTLPQPEPETTTTADKHHDTLDCIPPSPHTA